MTPFKTVKSRKLKASKWCVRLAWGPGLAKYTIAHNLHHLTALRLVEMLNSGWLTDRARAEAIELK